jgi:hypothetical protein
MRNLVIALAVVLLLASTATAFGGWYVGPRVVYAYPPVAPVYSYPAPVVVSPPQVVYSPVVTGPLVAPAPVVVGPPAVIVGPRFYVPGQPVRNVLRAVAP